MSNEIGFGKRKAVLDKYNGLCGYCGVRLATYPQEDQMPEQFCIDHILPRTKGGTNDIDNLMPACRLCNSKKGKKTLEEFRYRTAWLGKYGVIFTPHQIEVLKYMDFELPALEKEYTFFFENYG